MEIFNFKLFNDILRKHENDATINVNNFKFVSACQPGENFTCDVKRAQIFGKRKVDGSDVEYETSLIIKQIPANPQHAKIYRSKTAMQNEVNAYSKIIPVLEKYAVDGTLPVAKCLQAVENYIVLEDLTLQGYKTVSRTDGGLTETQCRAVMQALAKLHAASLILGEKEPQTLQELSTLTTETIFTGGEELIKGQEIYIAHALRVFNQMASSPEQAKAVKFLTNLHKNVDTIVRRLLEKPNEYSVVGHGDAWVCNMMFNANNEVKLIDLQFMRYNSVAVDLCHLFYVNLNPALCGQRSTTDLLMEYFKALHDNIKAKGVTMDNSLTMDWLLQEMKRYEEYAIIRALWIMPLFFYKPEDVSLENVSEDLLNDVELMNSKVGDKYIPRMKELILNFIKVRNVE